MFKEHFRTQKQNSLHQSHLVYLIKFKIQKLRKSVLSQREIGVSDREIFAR